MPIPSGDPPPNNEDANAYFAGTVYPPSFHEQPLAVRGNINVKERAYHTSVQPMGSISSSLVVLLARLAPEAYLIVAWY